MPIDVRSTPRMPASTSYAASRSRKLSSRVPTSQYCRCAACPRRSNVMQMQPRAAAARARSRSCSWLPPQPCTNSRPGTVVAGASSVPARRASPTVICSCSSSASIAFNDAVFGERSNALVVPVELDLGIFRYLALAVDLECRGAHDLERRVGAQLLQRGDLCGARAADAPGLLEHAGAPVAVAGPPARDVVVAARRVQARERLECRGFVDARLQHGLPRGRRQYDREQRVIVAAYDRQVRSAIHGMAPVVLGEPLRAPVARLQVRDAHAADAIGLGLLEVLLDDEARLHQIAAGKLLELCIDLACALD